MDAPMTHFHFCCPYTSLPLCQCALYERSRLLHLQTPAASSPEGGDDGGGGGSADSKTSIPETKTPISHSDGTRQRLLHELIQKCAGESTTRSQHALSPEFARAVYRRANGTWRTDDARTRRLRAMAAALRADAVRRAEESVALTEARNEEGRLRAMETIAETAAREREIREKEEEERKRNVEEEEKRKREREEAEEEARKLAKKDEQRRKHRERERLRRQKKRQRKLAGLE